MLLKDEKALNKILFGSPSSDGSVIADRTQIIFKPWLITAIYNDETIVIRLQRCLTIKYPLPPPLFFFIHAYRVKGALKD